MVSALDEYFSALVAAAESATGASLDGGTVIAPEAGRADSGSATSYPTPMGTIVWCDPAVVETLIVVLAGATGRAIESSDFVSLATAAGATLSGFGHNRVLTGDLQPESVRATDCAARRLDGDDPEDRALLAALASVVSQDDLDQTDLDLDELDPFIVGLLVGDRLVAYGSGRPSRIDDRFDDIGVLTHPDHRRRRLGALAVGEFVRRRLAADRERRMLYRCAAENAGSNAIAETLGFTLAHTIGAVRFDRTPAD